MDPDLESKINEVRALLKSKHIDEELEPTEYDAEEGEGEEEEEIEVDEDSFVYVFMDKIHPLTIQPS